MELSFRYTDHKLLYMNDTISDTWRSTFNFYTRILVYRQISFWKNTHTYLLPTSLHLETSRETRLSGFLRGFQWPLGNPRNVNLRHLRFLPSPKTGRIDILIIAIPIQCKYMLYTQKTKCVYTHKASQSFFSHPHLLSRVYFSYFHLSPFNPNWELRIPNEL